MLQCKYYISQKAFVVECWLWCVVQHEIYEQHNVSVTLNIFKDKGQGNTANAFKSRYWLQSTGFDMNTYITNQRSQNVTMTLKVKCQSHKTSAIK